MPDYTITDSDESNSLSIAYVNSDWGNMPQGIIVSVGDGSATIGYDAFASIRMAEQAVDDNGIVEVVGGDITFWDGYSKTVVVDEEATVIGKAVFVKSIAINGTMEFSTLYSGTDSPQYQGLSFVSGSPRYTLCVNSVTEGTYMLAADVGSFDDIVSIVDSKGKSLGTFSVGNGIMIDQNGYTLSLENNALVFRIEEPTITAIKADITAPTNRDVTVTPELARYADIAAVLYRIGETGEWMNYVDGVTVSDNTIIYFKTIGRDGKESMVVSRSVNNIDKTVPSVIVSGIVLTDYRAASNYEVFTETTVNSNGVFCIENGGVASNTTINSKGYMFIDSGGLADKTTVNPNGRLLIWGGTATEIMENGGDVAINDSCSHYISFAPNAFSGVFVADGHSATVHSGTTAVSTTLSNACLYVYSGGTATSTTVDSYGYLYISSGGSAIDIIWTPCVGALSIEDGGYATFFEQYSGVYYGSANELLSQAQTMESMNLSSSCSMYVMSNGQADHTTVDSFGSMFVSNGGVANNTTVNNWGYLQVSNGGIASDTTVNDGGSMFVFSNGSANGVVNSGRLVVFNGGAINDAVNHGKMAISDGGVANSTMVNSYGCLYISSGGTASNTTVSSGSMFVSRGGMADTIWCNDYLFVGGTVNNTSAHLGCIMSVFSGGMANNTTVRGRLYVNSGGTADNTILLNYRDDYINDDMFISSGGFANHTTVNNHANMIVSSGGTAANTTINSGGNLNVYSGAKLTGKMTFEKDAVISLNSSAILNFDLTQSGMGGDPIVNGLSLVQGTPIYTLTVDAGQPFGNYILADGASGFDRTITVNTTSCADIGELTVGQTINIDGVYYSLNLSDENALEVMIFKTFCVYQSNMVNGYLNKDNNGTITLSFTEEIDKTSFTLDWVSLNRRNGDVIAITDYEISGHILTLNCPPLTDGETYTLFVSEKIKNQNGTALDQNQNDIAGEAGDAYVLPFTADFSAPKVVNVSPDEDIAGTLKTVRVTFSCAIDFDSVYGQISLIGPDGQEIVPLSYKPLTASCIEVTVPEQTAFGQYKVKIGSRICDLAGNRLDQNGDGVFGGEDDNYASTFNITKIELKVSDVQLSKEVIAPGETLYVTWKDYNNGGYALSGSWTDGIYLSKDTRWDVNDVLLGSLTHEDGLAQDQQLSNGLDVSLAGIASGTYYLLVRSDIYLQKKGDRESALAAQNLEAIEITVELPELIVDGTVSGTISKSGDYAVYHFTQDANESLRLVLDSKTDSANMEIYVGYDYVPTREKYELKAQRVTDRTMLLNAPDSRQDIYVLVYNRSADAAFNYDLSVESVPMSITDVIGVEQGNRNGSIFELTGVDFTPDTRVSLTTANGQAIYADKVVFIDSTRIKAEFSAGTLNAGQYRIAASTGASNAEYEHPITIVNNSGGELEFSVSTPAAVGRHAMATLEIKCANVGYDVMDSVLLFVSPTQSHANGPDTSGAILTLDKSILTDGFWTSTMPEGFSTEVSFFASGKSTGLIMPGETVSTTVYYNGWVYDDWDFGDSHINWNVSYLDSTNTTELDWKQHLLNAGKTESQAELLGRNLTNSIGTTWGDYVKMLNRNLRYLYESGISTENVSVTDLFNLEYKWASGGIAGQKELSSNTDSKFGTDLVSLDLTRKYFSGIDSRLSASSFGVGWSCSWDMSLEIAENGDLTFDDGEDSRVYQPNFSNGYQTVANDGSVMKKLKDGGYQLTESNGTVRLFDANGLLISLVDGDGNKTTFSYENGKLVQLTAGTEIRTITRNAAGLITSVTDQNGFVCSYGYDEGNHLVSVTDSEGGTATYAYDGKSLGGLASISGNDAAAFSYDENGRLVSVVRDGHKYAYDYGVTGKVSVSRDGMTVGTNYYGLNGSLVKTIAADNATAGYIVTGCLTDANGTPLVGITVNAIADGKVFSSVTDANGAYVFAGLQETFLNLIVQDDAYFSLDEYLTVDGITFADRTLVQAKNSVSGTYTYADAAESATVILTDKATGEYSIISGYAGKFAAYDLKAGDYDLQISAGDSAVFQSSFSVTEESKYQTLGNFDLKVGGNLSCTVTADSVQDNVFAVLYDSNGAVAAVDQLSSSGAFTFENIAEGTYTLTISSPWGGADVSQEVRVTALKTSEVQVHLDDGIRVSGVIENANGAAMPGLYLLLSDGENEQLTYTGKDGDYSFEHLLPGDYTLSVLDNGMPLESFSVTAGQNDLYFSESLDYIASWSGHLHDAEGKNAAGTVSLYLDDEYLDSVYTSGGYFRFDIAKEGNYSVVAESDAGFFQSVGTATLVSDSAKFSDFTLGTISLTVQSDNLPAGETAYLLSQLDAVGNIGVSSYSYEPEFTGLTAGKYRLTAYNGNYKAESEFDVSEDMELKVAFEQLNELKVQLQDIREALNLLLYDGNGELVDTLYIDESGIYTFTALEAASYKLVAFSDNYNAVKDVTVTAGDSNTVSLPLSDSTKTISGTVTVDGVIQEGVTVYVYNSADEIAAYGTTGEDGAFSLKVMQSDQYSISTDYWNTKSAKTPAFTIPDQEYSAGTINLTSLSVSTSLQVQDNDVVQQDYVLASSSGSNMNSMNIACDWSVCKKCQDLYKRYLAAEKSLQYAEDALEYAKKGNKLKEKENTLRVLQIVGDVCSVASSFIVVAETLPILVVQSVANGVAIGSGIISFISLIENLAESFKSPEFSQTFKEFLKKRTIEYQNMAGILGMLTSLKDQAKTIIEHSDIANNPLQYKLLKGSGSVDYYLSKFGSKFNQVLSIATTVIDVIDAFLNWNWKDDMDDLSDELAKINEITELIGKILVQHEKRCGDGCKCGGGNNSNDGGNPPPPGDPGGGNGNGNGSRPVKSIPSPGAQSEDPNDKTVTEGFGEAGFVSAGSVLNYKVEFENDPEWANAPARWVRVYDTLADEFDLDSFELKSICIAGNYIEVGDGRDSFNDLRELIIKGEKVLTQISVNLDYETRQLFAEFTAIDPETGWMLQDVLRGFLLPNDEIGSGEGFFTYSVALKEDIAHGTEITNTAKIYFDFNDPIDTPTTLNTVDRENPSAAFTASVDGTEIKLALNGTDADSGIAGYNILYSSDGENFSDYGYTMDAEVSITGSSDTVYYFKIQAVDNVGNVSGWSDIKSIKTAGEYPDKPTVSADIVEATNQDVTLTAHFSKDSVIKEYSFDCEEWYVYSDGIVVSENGMVYFRGTNAMGKVSEVASFEVNNIDRIAPDTPIASANITSVTNEDVLVSAMFSDDSVTKEYSFDGQTWSKYEDAVKFTDNGTVSFRGIDAAGNVSEISTYDVRNIDKIAPEAPTVSSNAATAVYGGILVTAAFTDDSVVREYSLDRQNWLPYTTAILFTSNGSVSFRGTDAAGNVSEVTTYVVSNIVDPANKPDDGKNDYLWTKKLGWNTANILVANTIADNGEIYLDQPGSIEIGGKHNLFGNDGTDIDAGDVAKIEVSTAAKLTFRIDSNAAGTFYVYQDKRNKKGERERITVGKVTVKADKTATLKDICLTADGSYYVAMIAKNVKKAGTEGLYNVSVTSSTFFADADNGNNDIALKGKMVSVGRGTQAITLDNEPMTESSEFANFVGFSDNIDYAKLDLASRAYLSFDLKADGTAKFTIWKQDAKGKLTKVGGVTSLTAKNGYKATTKAQFLDTSKYTYYVSMESTDAAKGGSAYYNVELNGKTLFFDSADTGANNVLYDKKAKAFKDDANFVTTELAGGSQDVLLDSNAIGNEAYGNFIGYGDAVDYAKIVLTTAGSLSFTLSSTGDATFVIYRKGTDKNGKEKLETLQTTNFTIAKGASIVNATTNALSNLAVGDYYISMTTKNTKANDKVCTFYNVTARFTASDSAATSLAMPETGSFAMTDNLTFGQYDASAAGGLSDFALQNIFEATDNGNLASL